MMVGPALSTRLPFEDEHATVLGGSLDAGGKGGAGRPPRPRPAPNSSARKR